MDALDRPVDLSYEPFSRSAEYVAANRALVEHIATRPVRTIVDLACGTGTLSDLVLELLVGPDAVRSGAATVIGIDLSAESLELTRSHLLARWPGLRLDLIEASAERISAPDAGSDVVVMGNAIHLFDDKPALLEEVARALRPGGAFAFNTSFYAGTFPDGTERLYLDWTKEALRVARVLAGPPRRAGRQAFSVPWLAPEEYAALARDSGLRLTTVEETVVHLTARNLEDVGAYSGLATVLLPGFEPAVASEALVRAAEPTFERAGLTSVPRRWLQVVAVRP